MLKAVTSKSLGAMAYLVSHVVVLLAIVVISHSVWDLTLSDQSHEIKVRAKKVSLHYLWFYLFECIKAVEG